MSDNLDHEHEAKESSRRGEGHPLVQSIGRVALHDLVQAVDHAEGEDDR